MTHPFTHVRELCIRVKRLEGWVFGGLEPVRREEAVSPLYANEGGPLQLMAEQFKDIF